MLQSLVDVGIELTPSDTTLGEQLQDQMLMLHIDRILGTCKKNILTHVYTATWNVVATPQVFVDTEPFIKFGTVICEDSYERIHGRQWMYAYDLLKGEE